MDVKRPDNLTLRPPQIPDLQEQIRNRDDP